MTLRTTGDVMPRLAGHGIESVGSADGFGYRRSVADGRRALIEEVPS